MLKQIYFLFLICFVSSQTIFADGIIKEQSLSTSEGKSLIVKSACGDIKISSWSKSEAYIKITGNENAKNNLEFTIEEKSGDIYVTGKKAPGIDHLSNINLKIEISIPEKFNAKVSTAGGDIGITELTGNVDFKTAGGNIVLKSVTGNIDLNTAGGDIKIESSSGEIHSNTAGGDININGSNGTIEAKTAGGDITVYYSGNNKGMELKTSGGDVKLYVPDDFAANIDLKTSSGTITLGFPFDGEMNKSASKITGKINNGGDKVTCKTSGGDIVLTKK